MTRKSGYPEQLRQQLHGTQAVPEPGPFRIEGRRRVAMLEAVETALLENTESVALRANQSHLSPHLAPANVPAPAAPQHGRNSRLRVIRGEYSADQNSRALRESDGDGDEDPRHAAMEPPERSYDCSNYDTCLGLAAALDWSSFTCGGCSGAVNEQLLWRAHHRLRNNPEMTKLCNLPILPTLPENE